jgi:hypothetical protein
MAKSKSPKNTDTNEAVSPIVAPPSVPNPPAAETPAILASATSTKAKSTKPKATKSRAAKSSAVPSSTSQTSVPKLEAVPTEGRTNGEARSHGDAHSKSEGRSNVVPINLEDEIRKVAYLLSERRGFAVGHEREDWLAAEREVLQRYHQQQRA